MRQETKRSRDYETKRPSKKPKTTSKNLRKEGGLTYQRSEHVTIRPKTKSKKKGEREQQIKRPKRPRRPRDPEYKEIK